MRYSSSIVHVPGKSLWTADTLSRSPVKSCMSTEEQGLMEGTKMYVHAVMEGLPVSPMDVESLKEQLKVDSVLLTCHDPVHRRMASTCETETCTEKLRARASYVPSERRLIAERHKACYTYRNEERHVSETA